MPIYEYECTNCGKVIEAWQKFSDPPLTTCEHCKGKLRKLISLSTFHLKGSGWYVTDYAGKKADSCSYRSEKESSKDSTSESKKKKDTES